MRYLAMPATIDDAAILTKSAACSDNCQAKSDYAGWCLSMNLKGAPSWAP
jgi:hypothetical protein